MFWKPWQKPATKIVSMNCTELILMITAVSAISQLFDVSKIYLCQVMALSSKKFLFFKISNFSHCR